MPNFLPDDYFALPNMSKVNLKGCHDQTSEVATLDLGTLTIDTTKCANGGKYSKIQKGAEADGYRSLLWIKFEGDRGKKTVHTNDEYVIVKCFTKSSGMIQRIYIQSLLGSPTREDGFERANPPAYQYRTDPRTKPNVVMVVLESVSHAHFRRSMPLTRAWISPWAKPET